MLSGPSVLGTGWDGFTEINLGDMNGDGLADIVARGSTNALLQYTNTGGSGLGTLAGPIVIGTGWGAMSELALGAVHPGVVVQQVNAFSAFDSNVYKSVRANCPAGQQVIGTGYQLLGAEGSVVLDDLIPARTSVLVGAGEVVGRPGEPADGTTRSWQIEATALCVPTSSMTLQIVSAPSHPNPLFPNTQDAGVPCPAGTKALGMGAALSAGFGQVSIGELLPTADTDFEGVFTNAKTDRDGFIGAWSVTAYAICGPALPGLNLAVAGTPNSPPGSSDSPQSITLVCPTGQTVLSPGFFLANGRDVLITKAETGQRDVPNGATVTGTERSPGIPEPWAMGAHLICADGTTTPIVTPFNLNGRWDAGFGAARAVTIREDSGIIAADMFAFGRPTARGGVTDNSHITVSFPDDQTYTGTLVAPNRIVWSNGSVWTKF
jgi:hypothetical protein